MAFRRFEKSRYPFVLIAAWSAVLAASLFWNTYHTHQTNLEKARIEARTLFEETLAFRGWSAFHGGVYVPVSDKIQPNPYLTVPDRDIVTREGRKFTLVNPAWMTRLVFERLSKQSALPVINHLTSLKYINPVNKPDGWEEKGLLAFERGAREISEEVVLNNEPYLRLLKPFMTEEGCLKCHGHQGYKVGDVRGGMSVAVPLRPFFETGLRDERGMVATHGILWLIGMGGILAFAGRIQRKQQELITSEKNYRLLFENNPHPMWVYDLESLAFLTVNDAAVTHYGYSREEFLAMTIRDIRPSEDVPRLMQNIENVTEGVDEAGIWQHLKKDGTMIYVEITSHTLTVRRPARRTGYGHRCLGAQETRRPAPARTENGGRGQARRRRRP